VDGFRCLNFVRRKLKIYLKEYYEKVDFFGFNGYFFLAGFIDGNELYKLGLENYKANIGQRCNWLDVGNYEGYIVGVFDSYDRLFFYSPNNIKFGQVFDIVFKYLQNHPEKRNLYANIIVLKSLQKVWLCKKNNFKK